MKESQQMTNPNPTSTQCSSPSSTRERNPSGSPSPTLASRSMSLSTTMLMKWKLALKNPTQLPLPPSRHPGKLAFARPRNPRPSMLSANSRIKTLALPGRNSLKSAPKVVLKSSKASEKSLQRLLKSTQFKEKATPPLPIAWEESNVLTQKSSSTLAQQSMPSPKPLQTEPSCPLPSPPTAPT